MSVAAFSKFAACPAVHVYGSDLHVCNFSEKPNVWDDAQENPGSMKTYGVHQTVAGYSLMVVVERLQLVYCWALAVFATGLRCKAFISRMHGCK